MGYEMSYYAIDMDQEAHRSEMAVHDYIVEMAREHGTDDICQNFCPYYCVIHGYCYSGCVFPSCRTGRILKEEGIIVIESEN